MSLGAFLRILTMNVIATLAALASTIPYPNKGAISPANTFTATGGDIIGYYYGGQGAADSNSVGIFADGSQVGVWSLNNHDGVMGDMVNFGPVSAGTPLLLAIQVNGGPAIWYSDPALNSDDTNHTYTTPFAGNAVIPAGEYVSFEDTTVSASDLNYNDAAVVLINVAATPAFVVPEPAMLSFLSGACAWALCRIARPNPPRS